MRLDDFNVSSIKTAIDMQTKVSYSTFLRSNYMRQSCKPVERLGHPNNTFRFPSPDRPIFLKK